MGIAVSKSRTAKVTIVDPAGSFDATIRSLSQLDAQHMQASFSAAMARLGAARKAARDAVVGATGADQAKTPAMDMIPAIAEALPDLIRAAAFGLVDVSGLTLEDEGGAELRVPLSFEERYEFINDYFKFQWTVDVAIATFNHNTLTGADRGN